MGRPRTWPNRDAGSLKCKFKEVTATPKPTGTTAVPIHIALVQQVQKEVDEETSVRTLDDGLDDGKDDASLLRQVAKSVRLHADKTIKEMRHEEKEKRAANRLGQQEDEDNGGSAAGSDDEELDSDCYASLAEEHEVDHVSAFPHVSGVIQMRDGSVIDMSVAAELGLSDSQEGEEDLEDKGAEVATDARDVGGSANTGRRRATGEETSRRATRSKSAEPRTPTSTRKAAGQPKQSKPACRDTVMSPSRTPLKRNPARAAADEREQKSNPKKSTMSARLGGQDLCVVRDNIAQLTKRYLSESTAQSVDSTYTKTKRVRTARKLSDLERSLSAAEKQEASGGSEIMELVLMFREEAERKAAADEKRRREEREDQEAAEHRDREERDRVRREEAAAAAEMQRKREQDEAKQEREERRRLELMRLEQQNKDREESRCRYEESMRLDREEAKNQHEQMMLMFAGIHKK